MDEVNFRRAVLADPNTRDPDVIAAAKEDVSKMAFWQDIKQQDALLQGHLNKTPVPDNLADKLLWVTQSETANAAPINIANTQPRRRTTWMSAIAASVVIGLSSSLYWLSQDTGKSLLDAAYAHAEHKHVFELFTASAPSLEQVNAKLATYGAVLTAQLDAVLSANFCELKDLQSLHLLVGDEAYPTSIFFLAEGTDLGQYTQGQRVSTEIITMDGVQVVILGEISDSVSGLAAQLKQQLSFK